MPEIDSRLLEADDEMRITENFNRVLDALDELTETVSALTERVEALEAAGTQTDETEPAAQTDGTELGEQDGGEGQ